MIFKYYVILKQLNIGILLVFFVGNLPEKNIGGCIRGINCYVFLLFFLPPEHPQNEPEHRLN